MVNEGSVAQRIIFPIELEVLIYHASDLEVPEFNANLELIGPRLVVWAWYVAMTHAIMNKDSEWVRLLWEAGRTVTVRFMLESASGGNCTQGHPIVREACEASGLDHDIRDIREASRNASGYGCNEQQAFEVDSIGEGWQASCSWRGSGERICCQTATTSSVAWVRFCASALSSGWPDAWCVLGQCSL